MFAALETFLSMHDVSSVMSLLSHNNFDNDLLPSTKVVISESSSKITADIDCSLEHRVVDFKVTGCHQKSLFRWY